jgi:hypothetical protein
MACLACWIGDSPRTWPGAVNALTCQMLAGSTSWPSIRQMILLFVSTWTRSLASNSIWLGNNPAPARSTTSPKALPRVRRACRVA